MCVCVCVCVVVVVIVVVVVGGGGGVCSHDIYRACAAYVCTCVRV